MSTTLTTIKQWACEHAWPLVSAIMSLCTIIIALTFTNPVWLLIGIITGCTIFGASIEMFSTVNALKLATATTQENNHLHEIINTYRRWHKWEWEFSEEHGLSDITRQDYQRLKDGDTRINHEHIHLPEWNELDHRQKEAFTNTERQCLNAWFNTLDQMVLRIGKEQTSERTR